MLNNEIIIKRLALIKYLYKLGIEQSKQGETLSAFSLLSFHDSIEMFLKLIAEHHNIKSDNFNFLDYWTHIPTLTLKESMRNVNARRVNVKHKGLLPSKADIEISRVNTTDFFDQNVVIQLGINFSDVSLFSLISYTQVRELLESAQLSLEKNNFEKSVEESARAFDNLIYSYEISKAYSASYSPFRFGESMAFQNSFVIGMNRSSDNRQEQRLAQFVDKVGKSIEEIQKAVKILSLGIDYKKYIKFSLITPLVTHTMGGPIVNRGWANKIYTKENCQYCIDFVIDSSLNLQEFDFDIQELQEDWNPNKSPLK